MIVAFITDLFVQSQISQTALDAGVELRIVSSLYKLLPELETSPAAVLVDLAATGISPTSLIVQVKQRNPKLPLIAFGHDPDDSVVDGAREAGADHVVVDGVDNLAPLFKSLG